MKSVRCGSNVYFDGRFFFKEFPSFSYLGFKIAFFASEDENQTQTTLSVLVLKHLFGSSSRGI